MIWIYFTTLYSPLTEAQRKELWLSLQPQAVLERAVSQYWLALAFAVIFCIVAIRRARRHNAGRESNSTLIANWLYVPFLFWGLRASLNPLRHQYGHVLHLLNELLPALAALFLVVLLLATTTLLLHRIYRVTESSIHTVTLAIVAIISAVLTDSALYFIILYDLAR